METKPLILGYWKIRGKGHTIRMLLQYLHLPYSEVIYASPESFFSQRKQIAHLAHNLPYLEDGDKVIYDIMPIFIYLTKKYNREELMGKNIRDEAKVDMYNWDIQYLFKKIICTTFWKLTEEERQSFLEKILRQNIEPVLSKIQNIASSTSGWYLDNLSVVDFVLLELNVYFNTIFPGKMQSYPKLLQISKNVLQIPEIQELENTEKIRDLCVLPTQMCKRLKQSSS